MEIKTYIGEDLAKAMGQLGCSSAFFSRQITPTSVKYHFNLNNLKDINKVKKSAEMLGAYLHEDITVDKSKIAHYSLTFTRKEREFPLFTQYHQTLKNKPDGEILFGIDENGEPLTKNLLETKSILIGGSSGGGKSVLMNNIICSLICYSNCEMVLIDLKRCEFSPYRNSSHLIHSIITDYSVAIDTLKNIRDIIDKRYKEMEQMGIRKAPTSKFPILAVLIDEYAELASRGNKQELDNIVASIAATGRACNVFLIIATQHAVGSIISNVIKSNMQTKIGLRTTNIAQSMCIIGNKQCVNLLGYGDSYIMFDGEPTLKRVQVCNITDKTINDITYNLKPRTWNNENNLFFGIVGAIKTFFNKILTSIKNLTHSNQNNLTPYTIPEQNFYDCAGDDEE